MLKNIRKYSSSRGVKLLYALLAISFIGWGVGVTQQQQLDVVATVRGERITRRQLDDQTAILQRRFQEMLRGASLPAGLQLRGQALDQLIDDALVRHEADRLGLDVTDQDVVDTITTMPELQRDGGFDRVLFERVLEMQRDRGEFEAQVRQDLVNQRVRSLVVDGVQVSDAEIAEQFGHDREQVNLLFVRVPVDAVAASITVDDAEAAKWLADHSDRYRTAPQVRVRYAAYLPQEFAALAKPSDEAITAYYDAHRDDRFTAPEEVRARHILFKLEPGADEKARAAARKKAEDALAKAKGGADFAKLAKERSEDTATAAEGGDLGTFGRGKMIAPFETAAFALEPGGISEVVETPFGFHVIKVEEKRAGGPKPLDTVRAEIVRTLGEERGLELARQQAESDRREVVRGKRLADVAGSRLKETAPFAATDAVPGIGRLKAFTDAAFALAPDQPSDLIETDDAIYLLEPIERIEPRVPPLGELAGKPAADAKRAKAEAQAREWGQKILARAKEVGLEKAAAENQLPVEETGAFERRAGVVPKLSGAPELRGDAFKLTRDQPLGQQVYALGGDAVVVALKERIPADQSALADARDTLRTELLERKQQDAMQAFIDHLKQQAQRDGALEVRAEVVAEG